MMILASETISKRNNYSVKIQCISFDGAPDAFYWFVDQSTSGGKYFDNFEDTVEYIKTKKLLSPKQFTKLEGIKNSLLRDAYSNLDKLQHIEDIRNTAVYKGAKELLEIRDQLREDMRIPYSCNVDNLIMLHYLKEIGDNLYEIMQELQDR